MKKTTKKQKATKLQFGEPIQIVWNDTSGVGGWMSLHEEPLSPVEVTQVGYFMLQDKEAIRICQGIPTAGDECQVIAPTAIPMGTVKSIKRLKVG